MAEPDMRGWSFAQAALYELKKQSSAKKKPRHHHRKVYYWVQVRFTNGKIANYQLPKDLQGPLDHHRTDHPNDWKELLVGALINVPTTKYRDGQTKIRPAEIREILILPVGAHDSRWITRSQFVKPDYSWGEWLLNQVSLNRESNFLTHDFSAANQQRIKTILGQYRHQRVQRVRQQFKRFLLIALCTIVVIGLLISI